MAKASDIKNGNILRFNGELVQVEEFIHRTPGNLRAFYQARMRNVKTGKLVEYRFRTDEEVDIARVETSDYQYLYEDGNDLVIMDNANYEQHNVPKFLFGNAVKFLKEGINVIVAFESDAIPRDVAHAGHGDDEGRFYASCLWSRTGDQPLSAGGNVAGVIEHGNDGDEVRHVGPRRIADNAAHDETIAFAFVPEFDELQRRGDRSFRSLRCRRD